MDKHKCDRNGNEINMHVNLLDWLIWIASCFYVLLKISLMSKHLEDEFV